MLTGTKTCVRVTERAIPQMQSCTCEGEQLGSCLEMRRFWGAADRYCKEWLWVTVSMWGPLPGNRIQKINASLSQDELMFIMA